VTRQVEEEYVINNKHNLEKKEQLLLQMRKKHCRDNWRERSWWLLVYIRCVCMQDG